MSSSSSVSESTSSVADILEQCVRQQQELVMRVQLCEDDINAMKACLVGRTRDALLLPSSPAPSAAAALALAAKEDDAGSRDDRRNVVAGKMCDYCFKLTDCWPCPHCQREWYCSSPCQRLRTHLHHSYCEYRKRVE